jgi:hypothetical protein
LALDQTLLPVALTDLSADQRQRLACVAGWDLGDVRARVQRRLGWSNSLADEAILEYRKFIMLVALHPNRGYGMSEIIDEVWHQHILDTRDYWSMTVVGAMIHHEQSPLDAGIDLSSSLAATRHDLLQTFGGPISTLWPSKPNAHAVAKCCGHVVADA